MKKHIILISCDRCKKENVPGVQSIQVPIGSQPDAAGGPSETITEEVDLCPSCLAGEVRKNLLPITDEGRQSWLRKVKHSC